MACLQRLELFLQKYRPDIDGLRAVAVLPVVLFHAGIPGFSGGYVGVDVFFVISGYLITSILSSEMATGHFSLVSFYERRIRRILPALFTVIFISTIAALFILLPDEMKEFGKSVVATILFASNILFWQEDGYFDTEAEAKPLLHTWSLAVEEQFYIVFPIALWLCYRYLPRYVPWAVAVATASSFVLSIIAQTHWPQANFYLPFPRAWELLLGSMLALNLFPQIRVAVLRNGIAFAGLVAIFSSVLVYDGETPFPGPAALLPTLGAAAIIYAGMGGSSYIKEILGHRPIVFIGLVSYSFYLWHWPVLVFSKMFVLRDLTHLEAAIAVLASFLLAVLSWHYIERPFRTRSTLKDRARLFSATFASMAAFIVAGSIFVATSGLPQRVPEGARQIASASLESESFGKRYDCATSRLIKFHKYGPCEIGIPDARPSIAVWGDSHAMAMTTLFDELFRKHGISGILVSTPGCPPVFGLERIAYDIPCSTMGKSFLDLIERNGIKKVVLVSSWNGIFFEKNSIYDGSVSSDDTSRFENVRAGLHATFQILNERKMEVAFMMPTPGAKEPVPQTMARSVVFHRHAHIEVSGEDYRTRKNLLISIIESSPAPIDAVVDVEGLLCRQTCDVVRDSHSLYFDSNHPSRYLNQLLLPITEMQLASFIAMNP